MLIIFYTKKIITKCLSGYGKHVINVQISEYVLFCYFFIILASKIIISQ